MGRSRSAGAGFAGDIRRRAAQLVGLDQQVAGKVTAAESKFTPR